MNERDEQRSRPAASWDHFLQSSRLDIGFKQSCWWADFLATRGWRNFGVVVSESQGICGGAMVLVDSFAPGDCYYYIPHGPVLPECDADARQMFEALLSYIDRERQADGQVVSHLRIEPRWCERPSFLHGCRESTSWLDPRHTLCIDLRLAEGDLLQQMKPKGRYNIGLARRKGVSIVEDVSPQGVADFFAIYNETFERHGLRGHSGKYFRTLMEGLVATNRGSLFFAEFQGIRLATALVVYFGDTASYKYGGSLLAHRNVMAPYLLHFEIILRAKARGHKWYDFCGVAPRDKPNDRWSGFSNFKRKFGGCEQSFVPAFDYIYDIDAYERYRRRR